MAQARGWLVETSVRQAWRPVDRAATNYTFLGNLLVSQNGGNPYFPQGLRPCNEHDLFLHCRGGYDESDVPQRCVRNAQFEKDEGKSSDDVCAAGHLSNGVTRT